jgi:hypothetical protein
MAATAVSLSRERRELGLIFIGKKRRAEATEGHPADHFVSKKRPKRGQGAFV